MCTSFHSCLECLPGAPRGLFRPAHPHCRHSDILSDPNWLHNGTAEGGQLLAFPGAMYTVQSNTEHRVGSVQALDEYIIQCVYSVQGAVIKSNAVEYSFTPPGQS